MTTDPQQHMQVRCPLTPVGGISRYGCKVAGDCMCGLDDDLAEVFDRQAVWRARPGQPIREGLFTWMAGQG